MSVAGGSLWDFVHRLFVNQTKPRNLTVLNRAQIFPNPSAPTPLEAESGYFELWLEQMFLADDRIWFQTVSPAVQSVTEVQFGAPLTKVEISTVAGPTQLQNIDPAHLNTVIQTSYALTPRIPYKGGTVQINVGLMQMDGQDIAKQFLDAVGSVTSLLSVPQLSTALSAVGTVNTAVRALLGIDKNKMKLGFEQTLSGASSGHTSTLTDIYIVVMDADPNTYTAANLWIENDRLCVGNQQGVNPVAGMDYLVLHLRTTTTPEDWRQFPSIKTPFEQAENTLGPTNSNTADAESYVRAAVIAAWQCPDLTHTDRVAVAHQIWQDWIAFKQSITPPTASSTTTTITDAGYTGASGRIVADVDGAGDVRAEPLPAGTQAMRPMPTGGHKTADHAPAHRRTHHTLPKLADMPIKPAAPTKTPQTLTELFHTHGQ